MDKNMSLGVKIILFIVVAVVLWPLLMPIISVCVGFLATILSGILVLAVLAGAAYLLGMGGNKLTAWWAARQKEDDNG